MVCAGWIVYLAGIFLPCPSIDVCSAVVNPLSISLSTHICEKLLALNFFFGMCNVGTPIYEPTKPHNIPQDIHSWPVLFFSEPVHFSFRFDFNWHFCGHYSPHGSLFDGASKCIVTKKCDKYIFCECESTSTHHHIEDIWDVKVDNYTSTL